MNKKFNPSLRYLLLCQKWYYREKSDGRGRRKIGGANALPITLTLPQKRGPGVATWPHPNRGGPRFGDSPISSASFLVSAPGCVKTTFDFGFN